MKPSVRTWAINGDFLALRPTGVVRYAREVVQALDTFVAEAHPLTCDLDLVILGPRDMPEDGPRLRAIPLRVVPEYKYPRLPQFWVQAQLPRHVEGGLLSFCNLAPVVLRRHIVCIHDLNTRLMPESYGRGFRWAHRAILPLLGRRASMITTVSSLSRKHLVGFGVVPNEKITVTYNGSDHVARWDASLSRLEFTRARPFVLCLGQRQKYKNIQLLIRLAPMLDAMGLDIWMAGDIDHAAIQKFVCECPPNLHLLGRVSDDDLAKALSFALCFLFPSRTEGFGLPVVEAMALGCPVIASSAPCLPEVCGEAVLYASPDDVSAWLDAIGQVQTAPGLRDRLVARGYERARKYSWQRIAEIYLELMAEIDGAGHVVDATPPEQRVLA